MAEAGAVALAVLGPRASLWVAGENTAHLVEAGGRVIVCHLVPGHFVPAMAVQACLGTAC